jgi:hypothetical protein
LRAKNCRIAREDEGCKGRTQDALETPDEPHRSSFTAIRLSTGEPVEYTKSRTIDIRSFGIFAMSVSTTIRAFGVSGSRLAAIA